MTSTDNVEDSENELCSAAKAGKWQIVLKIYEEKKDLRTVKITETGDTVLHMAVSSGKVNALKSMVDLVCPKISNEQDEMCAADENGNEKKHVFGAENENGDTPLHLAASASNRSVEMCEKIGSADPSFITRGNKAGETPLFLAALHGNNEAFLWLHYHSPQGSSSCHAPYKREDNDTILHCAIRGGNINLAIDIVLLYKDHLKGMTMMCNKSGLSPFHLLAATPSAFESTDLPSRSFIVQLLYHWCFRVKKKKQATTEDELKERIREPCVDALIYALVDYVSAADDLAEGRLPCCIESIWLLIVFPLKVLAWVLMFLLGFLKLLLFLSAANWFHNPFQNRFRGIREMKEKHTWSLQIMELLLHQPASNTWSLQIMELLLHQPASKKVESVITSGTKPDNEEGTVIVDPPLMIAAKNGVIEMVDKILQKFPSTMAVKNEEGKNIVLLAVERRQTKLYQFLCENGKLSRSVLSETDKDGNTALHLAAKPGVDLNWQTTTMVEEFKWFEFVKSSMPYDLREKYNKDGKTAEEIFRVYYKEYMTRDRQWLNQTSQTCSVASTLVASMTFSSIVAENSNEKNYSSLVALSLSLTSTICFLAILAFRSQSLNFWRYVSFMLQLAILTMFGSIVSLWISIMLHGHSITACMILGSPIAILTIVSLPIFIGPTLMSMFTKVPSPSRKTTSAIHYPRPQKKEDGTDSNRNQEPTPNLPFRANDSLQDIGNPMTRLRIKRMNSW